MSTYEISIIIILLCRKLGSVRSVQQKIRLLLSHDLMSLNRPKSSPLLSGFPLFFSVSNVEKDHFCYAAPSQKTYFKSPFNLNKNILNNNSK